MISLSAAGPMATSIAPSAAAAAPARKADWRLILSALSSALPTIANSRASSDAQSDLLQGNAQLAETQRRADTMIGDEIAALRDSGPEADEVRSLADYSGAVQRNRQAASSSAPAPTLGGDAAKADTKAAAQQGAKHARQQATYAAGVDAPRRQREREGQRVNRVAGDVRGLGREATTAQFLARLRAQRRAPSPWVALLSQLGGQIADNYEPDALDGR